MKRVLLAVAAVVALACSATANAQTVDRAAVQKALIANENAVSAAFMKADSKTFHSLVAADGLALDQMGVSKVADIDKMMADYKVQSQALSDDQFIWLDNANVIHVYRWKGKASFQGQPMPGDVWSSTVWSNKGGKWMAMFHQESPVMVPPPTPSAAPAKK
jgi:hypothetical protein